MKILPIVAALTLLLATIAVLGVPLAQPAAGDREVESASDVVARLYNLVTFGPGDEPDWNEVESLFVEQAIIALRTTREKTTVFTVEGFIDDFKAFAQSERVVKNGFKEEIISSKKFQFGDIAHILVSYEAIVPGSTRPATQGVDSIQLIKVDGAWRIFSITNELPGSDSPLPAELRNKSGSP